jgi:TPR repeat protein
VLLFLNWLGAGPGSIKKPVEEVKTKTELGDLDSEFQLGIRYYNGDGVPRDWVEAVKWIRKAAEQGLAKA